MNKDNFENYIAKFGKFYSRDIINYIKENYKFGPNVEKLLDPLHQIYSYLEEIPEYKNIYIKILQMLEYYFTVNQDILEIGCGCFPELARRIDIRQQELKCGTIKAYDDKLVTTNLGRIQLYKERYVDQPIPYNLLLGFMPCKATELIINKAAKDKKEYFLGLCGCSHLRTPFPLPDDINESAIYREYIMNLARSTLDVGATLKIEYLEGCGYTHPILIKRYK